MKKTVSSYQPKCFLCNKILNNKNELYFCFSKETECSSFRVHLECFEKLFLMSADVSSNICPFCNLKVSEKDVKFAIETLHHDNILSYIYLLRSF